MSKQLSSFFNDYIVTSCFFIAEVVLSVLIESFEFTPSKKEIFWQMVPTMRPTVVGEGTEPRLPMIVKLVQP